MPTYVYRREDGTTFECFQRITADALTACPTTQQRVRRVISGGTGFILKGSGFYKTDYGRRPSALEGEDGQHAQTKGDKSDRGDKGDKDSATSSDSQATATEDAPGDKSQAA